MQAGTLDDSDNLVDTDISGEPTEVSAICNAVWTTDVKALLKAKLIADKETEWCQKNKHELSKSS